MVNMENYEEYLILYADNELDEATEAALMAFVAEYPELKAELAAYEATRLIPDEAVVYGAKESLLQPEPARKAIHLKSWWAYGAAAGLLVLLGIRLAKYTNTPQLSAQPVVASADAAMHRPVLQQTNNVQVTPVTVIVQVNNIQVQAPKPRPDAPAADPYATRNEPPVIAALSPSAGDPLPTQTTAPEMALPEVSLSAPVAATNEKKIGNLVAFGTDRPEILTALKDAANERIEQVRNIRKAIKGKDIAINIGNTELFTLHF